MEPTQTVTAKMTMSEAEVINIALKNLYADLAGKGITSGPIVDILLEIGPKFEELLANEG